MTKDSIHIWGMTLPREDLTQAELDYLKSLAIPAYPTLDWLWAQMDHAWDSLDLNNKNLLNEQPIGSFYTHPVWIINGVFTATDATSVVHRKAIAKQVSDLSVERIADLGGGFGELSKCIIAENPSVQVDIIEPFPPKIALKRLANEKRIRFVARFNGAYDCLIAQDVLEHVEDPINLAANMVAKVRMGGYLLFANCFYPVVKCHLPSTFHLRHTFRFIAERLGLKYIGPVPGASHAHVYRRHGPMRIDRARRLETISLHCGWTINYISGVVKALLEQVLRVE